MTGLTMEDSLFCELGDFLASAVVTRCQEEPVFCFIVPGLQEEIPPIIKHVGLNGKIIYMGKFQLPCYRQSKQLFHRKINYCFFCSSYKQGLFKSCLFTRG